MAIWKSKMGEDMHGNVHEESNRKIEKTIQLQYYALMRERRGCSRETLTTRANSALDLYRELQLIYDFQLSSEQLKVAVNDEFVPWETILQEHDTIVFIPPVAGG